MLLLARQLGDTLGKGSYAKVKVCRTIEDNQVFAIKIFKTSILKKRKKWDSATNAFTTCVAPFSLAVILLGS